MFTYHPHTVLALTALISTQTSQGNKVLIKNKKVVIDHQSPGRYNSVNGKLNKSRKEL
jgi:hypothetical protein